MKKTLARVMIAVLAFSLTAASALGTSTARADNASGVFTKYTDMLGEGNRLYELYEQAINDAVSANFSVSGLQSAMLNIGNGPTILNGYGVRLNLMDNDGTYGGKNSADGYLEKQGGKYAFGKDYAVPDGQAAFGEHVGDHTMESGEADLSAGTLWYQTNTTNADGAVVHNNRYDYLFQNGAMTVMTQISWDQDVTGRDDTSNTAIFAVVDGNKYQFVVGKATQGTSMPYMTFDPGMSTADAKTMMESAGYTIAYYGDISGGSVNLQ